MNAMSYRTVCLQCFYPFVDGLHDLRGVARSVIWQIHTPDPKPVTWVLAWVA